MQAQGLRLMITRPTEPVVEFRGNGRQKSSLQSLQGLGLKDLTWLNMMKSWILLQIIVKGSK